MKSTKVVEDHPVTREVLIQGCQSLLKKAQEAPETLDRHLGICENLARETELPDNWRTCYRFVASASQGWKHHTGLYSYPVPETRREDGYWSGQALEYRIDLLQYLIQELYSECYFEQAIIGGKFV